jgi:hypothetical protein
MAKAKRQGAAGVQVPLVAEREADPSDDGIPIAFFRGGIVDQNAIHVFVHPVAAVIPGATIANARHREETWCYPFVLDPSGRPPLCKKSGRRVILRVGN